MHYMICISGFSGVGKDEFTKRLKEKYGATQTGLVDPAKRHMADLYGFTEEQLFGPSKNRNSGDIRYPKTGLPVGFRLSVDLPHEPNKWSETPVPWWQYDDQVGGLTYVRQHDPHYWLSPREALQRYCELMNLMYGDTWVRKGIEIHKLIATGAYGYDRMKGIIANPISSTDRSVITVFADFRHHHEFRLARAASDDACKPIFIRIKHPTINTPPFNHRSEMEQTEIPDTEFDFIVENDGTIQELYDKADDVMSRVL